MGTANQGARQSCPIPCLQGLSYVNGVSLTVNQVNDSADGCEISINLIPHTVKQTTLKHLKAGTKVNLEVDTIARYCERMLTYRNDSIICRKPVEISFGRIAKTNSLSFC